MYTQQARNAAAERIAEAEFLDKALEGVEGLDPLNRVCYWEYSEPVEVRGWSDVERRAQALVWLQRHNRGIQAIARHARTRGLDPKVEKVSDEYRYGLTVCCWVDAMFVVVRAVVPASLTCEMVPTGETEVIPAREVPVMERRCPDSIFAGIEEEVTP